MASLNTMSGLWSVSAKDHSDRGAKISWTNYRERKGSLDRPQFKPARRFSYDEDFKDVRFLSYDGISTTYDKDHPSSASEPSDTESCGQPAHKKNSLNVVGNKIEKRGIYDLYNGSKSLQIYDSDDSGTASKMTNFREIREMRAYKQEQLKTKYLGSWPHSGELPYKSSGKSTGGTLQKGKKYAVYDSDDSGAVCGGEEESTSSASSSVEEPVDKFEHKFGHLFKQDLPPPRPRTMSHFNSMPELCSKRRAPLPPLPPHAQKSTHQQRPAESHRYLPRSCSSNALQSSIEGSGISTSTTVSYRKSLKRRLSLANLFLPSKVALSQMPEYFTQTAPSTMQSPSKMPLLKSQESSSPTCQQRCTSYTGPFYASPIESSESVSSFSSFNSTSSLGENSIVTVVPQIRFAGGLESKNSYGKFSSTGSSLFSTSSWGTSSFSSLQTLGKHERVELNESGFKSLSPTIGASHNLTQAPALDRKVDVDWRTSKLATILPSGHRRGSKPKRGACRDYSNNIFDNFEFRREKSSSEGCGIDDDSLGAKKIHANQHRRFTSLSRRQRFRKSIKDINSGLNSKMDYYTLPGSTKKKTLRKWLSSVTSKPEDLANGDNQVWIGQNSRSNSDSEVDEDTPMYWNPQFKDGLAKSRSETALNRMLDQNDVKNITAIQIPEPPPKLERNRWSRSLTELRLFTRVSTITADSSVDLSRASDEDWYLKHTRIIVLPHDTNFTEPPIYENVTCVIKPKPPAKPLASTLDKSLPTRQMPKIETRNDVANEICRTSTKVQQKADTAEMGQISIVHLDNPYQNTVTVNSIVDSCNFEKLQQSRTKSLPDICSIDKCSGQTSSLDFASVMSYNGDETEIPVPSNETEKKSTVLAELQKSKRFSTTQDCFQTMPSSLNRPLSQSPVVTKKAATPRKTGTVRELIQRFSSIDNLSHLNHTLPCRSPNRKFVKAKSRESGTAKNESTVSKQIEEGKNNYNIWDRSLSRELEQCMTLKDENQSTEVKSDPKSPESKNKNIPVPKPNISLTPDQIKLKAGKSSIETCIEDKFDESVEDDSPFTEMIKNSHVLKSTRNGLPEEDSYVTEASVVLPGKQVCQDDSKIHVQNIATNNKIDLINLRETRRRRLSLNASLCTSTLPTHKEEATFLEAGTKSMNFLHDFRYCVRNEENVCSNADEFEDAPPIDPNSNDSSFTNVKRSPFQKFKDSLYNSFHSHDSKYFNSTAPDVQSDLFSDRKNESIGNKMSKRQAYIQLKSLRTWKEVSKSSKNKQGSGKSESDFTTSNANGSSRSSFTSASPVSSRYHWSKTSDGGSDFSSNNSSLRSNRSLAAEFYARAPVDENWSNVRGQRSLSTGAYRENSWKFNPICNPEVNPTFGSLESSDSIHDRDRSITYSSHQANRIYPSPESNRYATDGHSSHYMKMLRNPKKYFKPPTFTFNLNLSTPQTDTDVGKYNPRRHSLSDFSPEITNNVGNLTKKLTPSTLYPLTLSPTSRDQVDWDNCRRQLPPPPPPPTFKPRRGPSSENPPLKSSPSLPLPVGPDDLSLPLRHTTSLGYPPYFCTKDIKTVQDFAENDARAMPPPMKYSGINNCRTSQHRSLLQREK